MTAPPSAPASGPMPGADGLAWPTLSADRAERKDPGITLRRVTTLRNHSQKIWGIGSNRAGPDGGHASQPAALDRAMTEKV
jgi:hypothetical protein